VEAVEALGQIGSPVAGPLLEGMAEQRRILGGGRTKDLRAAAASALRAIAARNAGGGGAS
jgi:HEAT repeat protein